MRNREGAFATYANSDVELVGFTTCDGCPGGNIEYTGEEMVKNGATHIHLATGMLVGYPPCPHIDTFKDFLESRYPIKVMIGTHPIPQNYLETHTRLDTWQGIEWKPRLQATMTDELTRKSYD